MSKKNDKDPVSWKQLIVCALPLVALHIMSQERIELAAMVLRLIERALL